MRSKKFKPIFLFVLGLIVYGGSNIYFNFYKRDGVAAIVQFFNSGFRLPQFSLPNIILAAMTEKFYSPNTFNI